MTAPAWWTAVSPRWRKRLPWILIVAAFALRIGYATSVGLTRPIPGGSDEEEYDTYAWNVAQGHGYRGMSPDVKDRDHLTAYRPPGPSLVYAAIYRVVGHHPTAIRIFNCALAAASCLLLLAIGRRTVGETSAWIGAIIWAAWPQSIVLSGTLLSEQLALAALLWLVLAALTFAERPTFNYALLAGIALGTNLLVHPSRLFVLPVLGLWVLVQFRRSPRTLALATIVPIIALLMLVPWIVRNERVFGAFIPFSTMGGSVLLQGNNRIVATEPEYLGYNVWDTAIPEYADALRAPNDELERDRVAKKLAVDWILGHQDRWVPLTIAKIRRGWTPILRPHSPLVQRIAMFVSWGPILVLFLLGFIPSLLRFLKAGHPGWLLHMIILHLVALNVVFFGYSRYRYVVEPYCVLIAVGTMMWWISSRRGDRAAAGPPLN